MRPGQPFGLSAIEKNEIWRRWRARQTLHEIGRAFDKPHSSIRCLLLPRGGIPSKARRRSRLDLTRGEREDLSRGIASGSSIREIARHLDRSHAMVAVPPIGRMKPMTAWESAWRPKKCLLALHPRLREVVTSKLILDWSPKQISGWLKTEYPKDEGMRVSHETIYSSLFIQGR
jgi:Helix-turn-helix domain